LLAQQVGTLRVHHRNLFGFSIGEAQIERFVTQARSYAIVASGHLAARSAVCAYISKAGNSCFSVRGLISPWLANR